MRNVKSTYILSLILTLLFILSVATAQIPDAVLYLEPSSNTYYLGSNFTVQIRLNTNGKNVVVVGAYLKYNNSLLSTDDKKINFLNSVFNVPLEKIAKNGEINISMGATGDSNWDDSDDGFTGDGIVAEVTFTPLAPGNTNINFMPYSAVILDDGLGTNILGSIINGNYNIIPSCTEQWVCSSWTPCTNYTQTRTCNDTNNCGTTYYKPSETQSCLPGTYINSLIPSSGLVGTIVTIDGSLFTPTGNKIKFGSLSFYNLSSTDNKTILFTVPEVDPGDYNVSITTANGVSNILTFTVTSPPSEGGPICGNNICEPGEDNTNCPTDCPLVTIEPIRMEIISPDSIENGEMLSLTIRLQNPSYSAIFYLNLKDNLGIIDETKRIFLQSGELKEVTFEFETKDIKQDLFINAELEDAVDREIVATANKLITISFKPLFLDVNYVESNEGVTGNFVVTSEEEGTITIVQITKGGDVIYERRLDGAGEITDDFNFNKKGKYEIVARMHKGREIIDEDSKTIFVERELVKTPREVPAIIFLLSAAVVIVAAVVVLVFQRSTAT